MQVLVQLSLLKQGECQRRPLLNRPGSNLVATWKIPYSIDDNLAVATRTEVGLWNTVTRDQFFQARQVNLD